MYSGGEFLKGHVYEIHLFVYLFELKAFHSSRSF